MAYMHHTGIAQIIEVPAAQVATWQRSGWTVTASAPTWVQTPDPDGHIATYGGIPQDDNPYDDGALLLTGLHSDGSEWFGLDLADWFGGSGNSASPQQKSRLPGAWVGNRELKPKSMTITGMVQARNRAQARVLVDKINQYAGLYPRAFTVLEQADVIERWRNVVRMDDVLIKYLTDTLFSYSLQLLAPDPRMFAQDITDYATLPAGGSTIAAKVAAINALAATADRTWDPSSFDAFTPYGEAQLVNPGNYDGPMTITVKGPITGLRVVLERTGRTLALDNLVIPNGETITIACEDEKVIRFSDGAFLNSYVNHLGWMPFRPGTQTYSVFVKTWGIGSSVLLTGSPAWG